MGLRYARVIAIALAAVEMLPIPYLCAILLQPLQPHERASTLDYLALTSIPTATMVVPAFVLAWLGRWVVGSLALAFMAPVVWVGLMLA